ncbi:uncharacterized protein [Apostichopus japonicus]|uniref:uncharacterized protein isoform X3 n=1 Tax=Stichopus japonicus TaxID=307972 RepID=UPI003AB7349F
MANVKVAVRVRPLSKREEENGAVSVVNIHNETLLSITNWKIGGTDEGDRHRERVKYFSFDYVFNSSDKWDGSYVSQEQVYMKLGPEVINAACDGYNTCLFAYGQTSSGKTYTMVGDEVNPGLIPRISKGLFNSVAHLEEDVTYKFEISFMEIYNEKVRDLLAPAGSEGFALKVREHSKDGPYVPDLTKHLVSDYAQVLELLEQGMASRTTASTHMHEFSSRSHAIFTIHFVQAKIEQQLPSEIVSKINLVDLAGSERANLNFSKDRIQEGANINKSLVMLGNCISALGGYPCDFAENALAAVSMESLASEEVDMQSSSQGLKRRSNGFVPYRNSVLTWLLKDSLGGNAKTVMIATVSPASIHYNETMSTLRYARRATHIVNQPVINEDPHVRVIRELRGEILRLKNLLCSASLGSSSASLCQDHSINEMLQENEVKVDQLTEAWVDKWKDVAQIMQECNVGIRRESLGVVVESDVPHLIGLNDDISTGIILYHLQDGCTRIGRDDASTTQDIVLNRSADVEREHAVIMSKNDVVTLYPMADALCTVNGVDVHEPVQLKQGAVILVGRTNMFRFNHPAQAARMRAKRAAIAAANLGVDESVGSTPESTLDQEEREAMMEQMSLLLTPRSLDGLREIENDEKTLDSNGYSDSQDCSLSDEEDYNMESENQVESLERQRRVLSGLKREHTLSMEEAEAELQEMMEKLKKDKDEGSLKLQKEISAMDQPADFTKIDRFVDLKVNMICETHVRQKRLVQTELVMRYTERKSESNLERKRAAVDVQRMSTELEIEEEEKRLQELEKLVLYSPPIEMLSSTSSETSSVSLDEQQKKQRTEMGLKLNRHAQSLPDIKGGNSKGARRKSVSDSPKRSSSLSQNGRAKQSLPQRARSHSVNAGSDRRVVSGNSSVAECRKPVRKRVQGTTDSGSVFSRLYPPVKPKFEFLKKKDPLEYEENDATRNRQWDRGKLIRRTVSPSQGNLPPGKSSSDRLNLKHSYQPKVYENGLSINPKKIQTVTMKHSGLSSTLPRTKSSVKPKLSSNDSAPKKGVDCIKSTKRIPNTTRSKTNSSPDVSCVKSPKIKKLGDKKTESKLTRKVLRRGERKAPVWQKDKDSSSSNSPVSFVTPSSQFPKKVSKRKQFSTGIWTSLEQFPIQKEASEAYYVPWNPERSVSLEDISVNSDRENIFRDRSLSMIELPNRSDDEEVDIVQAECSDTVPISIDDEQCNPDSNVKPLEEEYLKPLPEVKPDASPLEVKAVPAAVLHETKSSESQLSDDSIEEDSLDEDDSELNQSDTFGDNDKHDTLLEGSTERSSETKHPGNESKNLLQDAVEKSFPDEVGCHLCNAGRNLSRKTSDECDELGRDTKNTCNCSLPSKEDGKLEHDNGSLVLVGGNDTLADTESAKLEDSEKDDGDAGKDDPCAMSEEECVPVVVDEQTIPGNVGENNMNLYDSLSDEESSFESGSSSGNKDGNEGSSVEEMQTEDMKEKQSLDKTLISDETVQCNVDKLDPLLEISCDIDLPQKAESLGGDSSSESESIPSDGDSKICENLSHNEGNIKSDEQMEDEDDGRHDDGEESKLSAEDNTDPRDVYSVTISAPVNDTPLSNKCLRQTPDENEIDDEHDDDDEHYGGDREERKHMKANGLDSLRDNLTSSSPVIDESLGNKNSRQNSEEVDGENEVDADDICEDRKTVLEANHFKTSESSINRVSLSPINGRYEKLEHPHNEKEVSTLEDDMSATKVQVQVCEDVDDIGIYLEIKTVKISIEAESQTTSSSEVMINFASDQTPADNCHGKRSVLPLNLSRKNHEMGNGRESTENGIDHGNKSNESEETMNVASVGCQTDVDKLNNEYNDTSPDHIYGLSDTIVHNFSCFSTKGTCTSDEPMSPTTNGLLSPCEKIKHAISVDEVSCQTSPVNGIHINLVKRSANDPTDKFEIGNQSTKVNMADVSSQTAETNGSGPANGGSPVAPEDETLSKLSETYSKDIYLTDASLVGNEGEPIVSQNVFVARSPLVEPEQDTVRDDIDSGLAFLSNEELDADISEQAACVHNVSLPSTRSSKHRLRPASFTDEDLHSSESLEVSSSSLSSSLSDNSSSSLSDHEAPPSQSLPNNAACIPALYLTNTTPTSTGELINNPAIGDDASLQQDVNGNSGTFVASNVEHLRDTGTDSSSPESISSESDMGSLHSITHSLQEEDEGGDGGEEGDVSDIASDSSKELICSLTHSPDGDQARIEEDNVDNLSTIEEGDLSDSASDSSKELIHSLTHSPDGDEARREDNVDNLSTIEEGDLSDSASDSSQELIRSLTHSPDEDQARREDDNVDNLSTIEEGDLSDSASDSSQELIRSLTHSPDGDEARREEDNVDNLSTIEEGDLSKSASDSSEKLICSLTQSPDGDEARREEDNVDNSSTVENGKCTDTAVAFSECPDEESEDALMPLVYFEKKGVSVRLHVKEPFEGVKKVFSPFVEEDEILEEIDTGDAESDCESPAGWGSKEEGEDYDEDRILHSKVNGCRHSIKTLASSQYRHAANSLVQDKCDGIVPKEDFNPEGCISIKVTSPFHVPNKCQQCSSDDNACTCTVQCGASSEVDNEDDNDVENEVDPESRGISSNDKEDCLEVSNPEEDEVCSLHNEQVSTDIVDSVRDEASLPDEDYSDEDCDSDDDTDDIDLESFKRSLLSVGVIFSHGKRHALDSEEIFDPYALPPIEEERDLPELSSSPVSHHRMVPSYDTLSDEEGDVALYQRAMKEEDKYVVSEVELDGYSDESDDDDDDNDDDDDVSLNDLSGNEVSNSSSTDWFPSRVEVALIKDVFTAEQDLPSDLVRSPDADNFQLQERISSQVQQLPVVKEESLLNSHSFSEEDLSASTFGNPHSIPKPPNTVRIPVSPNCLKLSNGLGGFSPRTNSRTPPLEISFASPGVCFSTASPCSSPESPPRKFFKDSPSKYLGSDDDYLSEGETTPNIRRWIRPLQSTRKGATGKSQIDGGRNDGVVKTSQAKLSKFVEKKGSQDLLVHQTFYLEEEIATEDGILSDTFVQSNIRDPVTDGDESDAAKRMERWPTSSLEIHTQQESVKQKCSSFAREYMRDDAESGKFPSLLAVATDAASEKHHKRCNDSLMPYYVTSCTQTSPQASPSSTSSRFSKKSSTEVVPGSSDIHLAPLTHNSIGNQFNSNSKGSFPTGDFRWDLFPPVANLQPIPFERSVSLPDFDNPLLVSPRKSSVEATLSEGEDPHQSLSHGPRNVPGKSRDVQAINQDRNKDSPLSSYRTSSPFQDRDEIAKHEPHRKNDGQISRRVENLDQPNERDRFDNSFKRQKRDLMASEQAGLCARCKGCLLPNNGRSGQDPTNNIRNVIPPVWEPIKSKASTLSSQEDFHRRFDDLQHEHPENGNRDRLPANKPFITRTNITENDTVVTSVDDRVPPAECAKVQSKKVVSHKELVPQRVQMPVFSDISFDSEFADHEFFSDEEEEEAEEEEEGHNTEEENEETEIIIEENLKEEVEIEEERASGGIDPDLLDDQLEPELAALMSDSAVTPVDPSAVTDQSKNVDSAPLSVDPNPSLMRDKMDRVGSREASGNYTTGLPIQRSKDHSNDYVLSVNINIPPFPNRVEQHWNPAHYTPSMPHTWPEVARTEPAPQSPQVGEPPAAVEGWMSGQRTQDTVVNTQRRFPSESTASHLTSSSGVFTNSMQTSELVSTPNRSNGSLSPIDSAISDSDINNVRNELEEFLLKNKKLDRASPPVFSDEDEDEKIDVSTSGRIGTERDQSWTSPDLESLRDERDGVRRLSNSWSRSDIAVELMEARIMHGIGETDAFLRFLENDIPEEEWLHTRNDLDIQHEEEKREILAWEKNSEGHREEEEEYDVEQMSLDKALIPSTGLSPERRKPPSEHLKFLQGLRKDLVSSGPPSFFDEKNEIEALLEEYKELHRNSESEIAQAQRELDGVRNRSTEPLPREPPSKNYFGTFEEEDGEKDLIDREIESLHAASLAMSLSDSAGSDVDSHHQFDFRDFSSNDEEDTLTEDVALDRGKYYRLNSDLSDPLVLVKTRRRQSLQEKLREAERQVSNGGGGSARRRSLEQCMQPFNKLMGEWSDSECSVLIGQTFRVLLRESAIIQQIQLDSIRENEKEGGWQFLFKKGETFTFEKFHPSNFGKWYSGIGVIKAPVSCIFNLIRKASNFYPIFGKYLKKVTVLQKFDDGKSIIHVQLGNRKCGLRHPRLVTTVLHSRRAKTKFLVGSTSVMHHPSVMQVPGTVSAKVTCFGFCLEPFCQDGMEHCQITVISQVELKSRMDAELLHVILQKLPSTVLSNIRGLVVVGHL